MSTELLGLGKALSCSLLPGTGRPLEGARWGAAQGWLSLRPGCFFLPSFHWSVCQQSPVVLPVRQHLAKCFWSLWGCEGLILHELTAWRRQGSHRGMTLREGVGAGNRWHQRWPSWSEQVSAGIAGGAAGSN